MASYEHPYWGNYAAITRNHYGEGVATYVGCCPSDEVVEKIIEEAVKQAGLWGIDQEIRFPLIVKSGNNGQGNKVQYYFNYSGEEHMLLYPYPKEVVLCVTILQYSISIS